MHELQQTDAAARAQRRLAAASMAVAALAGVAAARALYGAVDPVSARSLSARMWQAEYAGLFAWAALAYLVVACLTFVPAWHAALRRSWLVPAAHLAVVVALAAALARGPSSRILFAGHELLAAAIVVIAALAAAVSAWECWRVPRADAPRPRSVAHLGLVAGAAILVGACAWVETRSLPGEGAPPTAAHDGAPTMRGDSAASDRRASGPAS